MFGSHLDVYKVSLGEIQLYYLVVIASLGFFLYRYRKLPFSLFVVLLFHYGLFGFMGKAFQDLYKIAVMGISVYWLVKGNAFQNQKRFLPNFIAFGLFTIAFMYTSFRNGDYLTIIFSQYSKFFILMAMVLLFMKFRDGPKFKHRLNTVLMELLILQVVLSVWKFISMGITESIVGSIGAQGGAAGSYVPVLGFKRSWWLTAGLFFVGIMSVKRAIWFVAPIFILACYYYIPRKRIPSRAIVSSIIMLPLLLYLGIRVNPTLNKESKVWGSFDPQWTYDYVMFYSFGTGEEVGYASGRGGATFMLFEKIISGNLDADDLFGYGNKSVYGTNVEDFNTALFGINSKGAATGFFQTMTSNGFIGVVTLVFFVLTLIWHTRNKRLRNLLVFFFIWEYFFYTGIAFRDIALQTLLIYLIVMSNKDPLKKEDIPEDVQIDNRPKFAVPEIPG
jgi:hypothetical protein